jgi:hypothetical protein
MKTLPLLLAIACLLPATAAAQCNAGHESVTASVHDVTTDGKMNYYHIAATVDNGGYSQASSALQFVDMYQRDEKLDAKGVPPLSADGKHTVFFTWKRSVEAGPGSTILTFKLDPACTTAGPYDLRF